MSKMRPVRSILALLRLGLAAAFAFTSLLHGPVIVLAMNAKSPSQAMASHHGPHLPGVHHHHHDDSASGPSRAVSFTSERQPSCQAIGCFVLVPPADVRTPAVHEAVLETLSPTPANGIPATAPSPPDPPPRLRA
jgi:hypothetical protein